MLSQLSDAGVRVPDGFATSGEAFRLFLEHGSLKDRIAKRLAKLNVEDVRALTAAGERFAGDRERLISGGF